MKSEESFPPYLRGKIATCETLTRVNLLIEGVMLALRGLRKGTKRAERLLDYLAVLEDAREYLKKKEIGIVKPKMG